MAVNAPCPSTLNPNAPLFVPAYFINTEDFSPEWWNLVKTSPAFREYWIRERCLDEDAFLADENLDDLDDAFSDQQEKHYEDDGECGLNEEDNDEACLKEQDVNLCAMKPRVVKPADLMPNNQERVPREARQKISQVPSKFAAHIKKGSMTCRIQQPR